jgi:hypothetical protein
MAQKDRKKNARGTQVHRDKKREGKKRGTVYDKATDTWYDDIGEALKVEKLSEEEIQEWLDRE